MARIFKNKTVEDVSIQCDNHTLIIPGEGQADLSTEFTAAQLAACDGLVELLGQGTDKYQLNDGSVDLSVAQAIDLIRGYYPSSIQIRTAKMSDGLPVLATGKPAHSKLTLITPNWCDRCTWYQGSVFIEDEVAEDSGDHTTYNLAHQSVIDNYHGKISFEDFVKDSAGLSCRVVVKVNDISKTEQDPHYGAGGDFTVNYEDGKVTFLSALQGTDVVKVTYHHSDSSVFTIKPTAGKQLIINQVEVQFSEDTEMQDSVVFQAWGPIDVFAPFLLGPPYNYPSGTMIPLGDPLIYKTISDLVNDSNHAYPAYPMLGGSNWRAMKKAAYIFAWDYDVGATILKASQGLEIRVSLQHDTENVGTFATATFYATSEDET